MRADIRDADAVAALRPLEVAAYLRATGWSHGENQGTFSVWTRDNGLEVIVPMSRDLRDFALRMGDILRTLEALEGRSQLDIYADLTTTSSDVIRVRAHEQESADGTVTLAEGVSLVRESMDMMAAAACATLSPKAVYRARRPLEVVDFLQGLRLGQTERGSFVVAIVSRVPPTLATLPSNGQSLIAEPFERRVSYTLSESLLAARSAADVAAGSASFEAFEDGIRRGVNANLCDALVGMARHLGNAGALSIEITWARSRIPKTGVPSRVTFPRDFVPVLEEAARLFKERSPLDEYEIQGVVERLDRAEGSETGIATILAAFEGTYRKVAVQLQGTDYSYAIQSHERRIPLAVEGTLVPRARSLELRNPRNVRLEFREEN